jgi:hypothetical protein
MPAGQIQLSIRKCVARGLDGNWWGIAVLVAQERGIE